MIASLVVGAVLLALTVAVLTVAVYNLESKVKNLEKLAAGHGKWLQEHHFELHELLEPATDDGPYRTRLRVLPDGEPPVPEFGPRVCVECAFHANDVLMNDKNKSAPGCRARPHKDGGWALCAVANEKHDCALYRPKSRKPPPEPPLTIVRQ